MAAATPAAPAPPPPSPLPLPYTASMMPTSLVDWIPFEMTYDPPLIPSNARIPPGIVAGNIGLSPATIMRNRLSAITKVKIRN